MKSGCRLLGATGLLTGILVLGLALPAAPAGAKGADTLSSPLGSYLAGRVARSSNDIERAVDFYRHALTKAPNDPRMVEQAFLAEATQGNTAEVIRLARRLVKVQPNHRLARTWLGLAAFKARKFVTADRHFRASNAGPIGELTSALSRAWVARARRRNKSAMARLKIAQPAEWARYYLRYHRALISDLTGNSRLARTNFERIFRADSRMPRITIGYLAHAARVRNSKLVNDILSRNSKATSGDVHPAVADAAARAKSGARLSFVVSNAVEGMAEVYYGLGEALATEGGTSLGSIYLQMAIYLRPDFPFALAALANVHETAKRYEQANATYDRIRKGTPLQLSIDLRRASNLDALEQTDRAKAILVELANKHPKDLRPLETLASILRGRKRYDEAIGFYTKLINLVGEPKPRHWTYWYARGTCYEQTKRWPLAERDLLQANELSPNQPLVLNYLGYSWVDRNENLERGLEFIKKAVKLKPDDGYIVDSLGWAHFRLGNYQKATKHLERAVELRPEDPILNDHLGDAYWRVGRTREARYQWKQALTLKPEPDNATKIRAKLANGLGKPHSIARRRAKKAGKEDPKALAKRGDAKQPAPVR